MLIALAASFALQPALAADRAPGAIVEDATGRKVQMPPADKIRKIYPAGPPAAVLLFTLCPEKLVGFPLAMSAEARELLPPAYRNLPKTGKLSGRGITASIEEVLKAGTDAVVDVGTLKGANHQLAKETADKTGLPTLLLDGMLEALPATYRTLGRALDASERAEKLAVYIEKTLADTKAGLAKVPAEKRPRVYYGRGPKGLETCTAGSISFEAFDRAGVVNVAAAAGPHSALVPASAEDLVAWNPADIFTIEPNAGEYLKGEATFHGLDAVKAGRVYAAPRVPFGWVDYPPAVNQLLGLMWVERLLYPGVFPDDLRARVAEFHRLFYQQPLTDGQLDALLKGLALGK